MATKTATSITATLGAPQPAAAAKRGAVPAPTKASNTASFLQWKTDITAAREAVNYTEKSPIYGKTDIEVVTALRSDLEAVRKLALDDKSFSKGSKVDLAFTTAITTLEELLKRKLAKQVAGQAFKASKNS